MKNGIKHLERLWPKKHAGTLLLKVPSGQRIEFVTDLPPALAREIIDKVSLYMGGKEWRKPSFDYETGKKTPNVTCRSIDPNHSENCCGKPEDHEGDHRDDHGNTWPQKNNENDEDDDG